MAFSLHGIKLKDRKSTEGSASVKMPVPESVSIPTSMHIGKPGLPVVKVGDEVFVGTLIAEDTTNLNAPIHSSVSGKVKKITDTVISNGAVVQAIVIEADGKQTVSEDVVPPSINSKEDFINAVKKSGMVGLGGAGFPTYAKLNSGKPIDTLLLNGAECEPYITSDSVNMVERTDDISCGIKNLVKYLEVKNVIIGIEKGKEEAIKKMQEMSASFTDASVSVKILPKIYPQGGEKVLVYHATGKVIANGQLPIDVGALVLNVTTVAGIGKFIKTGMPLVEKCITVDGGAVKEPKNVIVPIGTSLKDVFAFCGGFKEEPNKVIYGGPMMGVAVPDISASVIKQNNAVLALTAKETAQPKETACIRCGTCVMNCPFGINATEIMKAYKNKDVEKLIKAGAELCMECGCCSFNCPASRPLVQTNALAKKLIREQKAKEAK